MYHEQIAKYTADHLRSHIKVYLDEISARYTGKDIIPLVVPKTISATSVVGGMWTQFDQILPQYGIDIFGRQFSQSSENLFLYEYVGQINGMVHASSEDTVDKTIKRHGEAVERFIKEHQLLHQAEPNGLFRVIEFGHADTDFSGAEQIQGEENKFVWVAGFSINVAWLISEAAPYQHA